MFFVAAFDASQFSSDVLVAQLFLRHEKHFAWRHGSGSLKPLQALVLFKRLGARVSRDLWGKSLHEDEFEANQKTPFSAGLLDF
jgi:hypothetical protein